MTCRKQSQLKKNGNKFAIQTLIHTPLQSAATWRIYWHDFGVVFHLFSEFCGDSCNHNVA